MVKIPIDDGPDENLSENADVAQNEADSASDEPGELEQMQEKLEEKQEQLLRLAADFENYKRQALRRETESKERAVKNVLSDLLPVLDNFERAVHATSSTQDVQNLRVGVEFILQQLHDVLRGHGVEPIEATGQPFDPQQHEAVEQVPSAEHEAGTIVEEAQRGYSYKGQVLRPSQVRVASNEPDDKNHNEEA